MKIAVVSPSYPPFNAGGVCSAHFNLGKALQEAGYEIAFFTYEDSCCDATDPPYLTRRGMAQWCAKLLSWGCHLLFHFIDRGKCAYQTCDILKSQWGAWRLRRALKKFQPAIVILPDRGCPALAIGHLHGVKSIVVSHHNPARFISPLLQGRNVSAIDIRWALALENYALRRVDMMLCPTAYMAEEAKKTYRFSSDAIRVAPNVLSGEAFINVYPRSVAQKLGYSEDFPVVYIPDAGSSVKGERYVFEVVRRISVACPNTLFLLTGTIGPVLEYELGFNATLRDKIYMPGRLSYLDNLAHIASCILCVSPTLAENFGMALIEAAYFGVPAVTFNTGGNAEIVESGVTGVLVPYLDVDALVDRAIYLLSPAQDAQRAAWGAAAKMKAHMLLRSGLRQYEVAIHELLEKKNSCQRP